jgi:PAS domain S-box-containing protein
MRGWRSRRLETFAAMASARLETEHELPLREAHRQIAELRQQLADETTAKARLQDSLDLRNAALDAASTNFLIIEATGEDRRIVYANRAVAEQYGYTGAHEVIGQPMVNFMGRFADSPQIAAARAALAEGRSARAEIEMARRDGSTFWVGFSTMPLRNHLGEITHFVSLGADITARREAARKERELNDQLLMQMKERERMSMELRVAQKLESVGRLAAGLAHEINTPIQYVGDSVHFLRAAFEDFTQLFHGYRNALTSLASTRTVAAAQLAELRELEATCDLEFLSREVPKAFERTLEGTERVAGIVRAMKEFAHPDTGEHIPADLNRALATTITVACNEYKYAATVSTEFGDLPLVTCNIGELNQVFLNLIVNAAHAIEDAGRDVATGRICVSTCVRGEFVDVSISDNGCGIPRENLDKLFDPFFTTKEVGRGTGQGLAIARSIVVDKHGGSMQVHSEAGVGTRFVVTLALVKQDPPPAVA